MANITTNSTRNITSNVTRNIATHFPRCVAAMAMVLALTASANPQTRLAESNKLRDAGQLDAAAAILLQLNQEYPELAEPYNNLAVIYVKQEQYEKARNTLEMAIRVNPNYATAYENLADLYTLFASYARAKAAQLREIQRSRPKP